MDLSSSPEKWRGPIWLLADTILAAGFTLALVAGIAAGLIGFGS